VILETERLVLRVPRDDDLDALAAIYGDPEVTKHVGRRTRDEVVWWIERVRERHATDGFGQLVVERIEDGRVIGRAGHLVWDTRTWEPASLAEVGEHGDVEIGWVLARDCWGRGYATEAGTASRDYALGELGRTRVIAVIGAMNTASIAVAERLGLAYERDIELRVAKQSQLYALSR
jgi:RimJ/RimL family protein N-acetyltransferase